MAEPDRYIRWGILGTGAVAAQFAIQLPLVTKAVLHAVASRRPESAKTFAASYQVNRAHETVSDLLADDAVDIVYIATPADTHHDLCLQALEAGKAVLCEKPFAMSAAEASAMAAAAKQSGVFCMEAMWLRFSPLVQSLISSFQKGEFGQAQFFRADAGYAAHPSRLESGGAGRGALLTFGVYGLSLAHALFGPPNRVSAERVMQSADLDGAFSAVLTYPNLVATVTGSVTGTLSNEAQLVGDARRSTLGAPFFNPGFLQTVDVMQPSPPTGGPPPPGKAIGLTDRIPYGSVLQGSFFASWLRRRGRLIPRGRRVNGLRIEALEATRCLIEGETESVVMPLNESVAVMETVDAVRVAAQTSG